MSDIDPALELAEQRIREREEGKDAPPDEGGKGSDQTGLGGDKPPEPSDRTQVPPANQPGTNTDQPKTKTVHDELNEVRTRISRAEDVRADQVVKVAEFLANTDTSLDRLDEWERRLSVEAKTNIDRRAKVASSLARGTTVEPYTAWWQGMEVKVVDTFTRRGIAYAEVEGLDDRSAIIPLEELNDHYEWPPKLTLEPEPTPKPSADPEPDERPEVPVEEPKLAPKPAAPAPEVREVSDSRSFLERKRELLRAKRNLLAERDHGRRRKGKKKFRLSNIL